jgi:hypothetical protein
VAYELSLSSNRCPKQKFRFAGSVIAWPARPDRFYVRPVAKTLATACHLPPRQSFTCMSLGSIHAVPFVSFGYFTWQTKRAAATGGYQLTDAEVIADKSLRVHLRLRRVLRMLHRSNGLPTSTRQEPIARMRGRGARSPQRLQPTLNRSIATVASG